MKQSISPVVAVVIVVVAVAAIALVGWKVLLAKPGVSQQASPGHTGGSNPVLERFGGGRGSSGAPPGSRSMSSSGTPSGGR